MSIFFDPDESTLQIYNSSNKQSLQDVSLDLEERDKIINELTTSISSELNVDYSDFSKHIFFDSAYAAVNFAAGRVVENYPIDGELKEKNRWRDVNSGFENWFFEQWPKQQGYLFLRSGSVYAEVIDHQGFLNYNSASRVGSFSAEAVILPNLSLPTGRIYPVLSLLNASNEGVALYLQQVSGEKYLYFKSQTSSGLNIISASYDSFASSSAHIAGVFDPSNISIFINGNAAKTEAVVFSGALTSAPSIFNVGHYASGAVRHYYSGSIDEVRVWTDDRSSDLIYRNFNRTIHANHSGGLKLYWKFNQPSEYGNKVLDYSGNGLHGYLTGTSFSVSNIESGTLGSWFRDVGDPILALENARVNTFLEDQRLSASAYDDENPNMIFNLVPDYFTEGDETEYQQLFLLLTARHYDKLKLYIEHLANVTKLTTDRFDGPAGNLLDLAAKNYGLDIGGLFSAADNLQYFFGENVNSSSGTIETSIKDIRESLKRNVLANFSYLVKTKSTRQSLRAALSTLGLDENIITINEYTDFSGGIKTTFTPRTIERRVASFLTSSNVYISSSAYTTSSQTLHQFRVLLNTGSNFVSQSLFSVHDGSRLLFGASVERNNVSSSYAKFRLTARNSLNALTSISSTVEMFDNKWVNVSLVANPDSNLMSFYLTSMDRNGLIFSQSNSASVTFNTGSATSLFLGTSGSNFFSGCMSEYRAWHNHSPTSDMYDRWGMDWETTEVFDVLSDIGKLKHHLKLNDFTSSATSGGSIHDWITGLSGSSYLGFTTSSLLNFPGKYIDKFESTTSYDLNVDNDKIRIIDGSKFTKNDINKDIPFVSINFSPINSLNKEIFKWIGDITKLSNAIGDPLNRYKETNASLSSIRSAFFREKISSKIDYEKFSEIIQWFDSNFSHLLKQLIPADMASSISSYIIEPHLLEFNQVPKPVVSSNAHNNINLETTITVSPVLTSSALSTELSLADPGRFGSFVSASAQMSQDFAYNHESGGINFSNLQFRKVIDDVLESNFEKNSPNGYGNGFYTTIITGSNYLKNILNVNPNFRVSGVYSLDSGAKGTMYLSSSMGAPESPFTGVMNGYQDARWLWMQTSTSGAVSQIVTEEYEQFIYDHGIGYGGLWGQLRARNNKSVRGQPKFPAGSKEYASRKSFPGEATNVSRINFSEYVTVYNRDVLQTIMLWPSENSYDGTEIFFANSGTGTMFYGDIPAASFGPTINIENYSTLNLEILGRTNKIGGGSNKTSIIFEIKFQFFSRDTPGTIGFESQLSSSSTATTTTHENIEQVYRLSTPEMDKDVLHNFNLTLQRDLPRQKFMRIFVNPIAGQVSNVGSFFVLTKGILSLQLATHDPSLDKK